MSEVLDRGTLLFASLAALAVGLLERMTAGPLPFYLPLLILVALYAPAVVLAGRLLGERADYGSVLTCAAMGWSASQIPLLAAFLLFPALSGWVASAAYLYWAVLMFFAVRNLFGAGGGASIAIVALSFIPLLALPWLLPAIGFAGRWLASPFFLFYAWYFLGGELSKLGAGMRDRQHFHKMLEAAAINPHDGDAQYQLGLIYQARRRYPEAIAHFQKAAAIDPAQTDALYQLGRIARQQGRAAEALTYLQTAARQDPNLSSGEVLRELGAAYLESGDIAGARRTLADYVERREFDPEGLYYLGQALEQSGDAAEAREMFLRAVEAGRTAPRYRRRLTEKWARLARKKLR